VSKPLKQSQPEPIENGKEPEVIPAKPRENGRAKSTINLQDAFKAKPATEPAAQRAEKKSDDQPLVDDAISVAWESFSDSRKHQIAEFQLLKRGFTRESNVITISLTNPVEEPLLQNLQLPLVTYLRDKLKNNSISVIGILQRQETNKVVYTNKEKFEHLANKNPALRDLKERLGLDTDY
jgi:DNA polymerase-3 subunit gamma/tau